MPPLRPIVKALCAFAALLLLAVPAAAAAPGELDPTFGSGGQVRLLESNEESQGRGLAVQPDGKVLVGGFEASGTAVLYRLLPNGAPDPGFGSGGKVTTPIAGGSVIDAIALQSDGKIVAAGTAKGIVNFDFFFARFNPDGSPDSSFGGGDGVEIVPVGSEEDRVEAVAISPDGKIVGSGTAEVSENDDELAVAVLSAGGAPDPGFGGGDGTVVKSTSSSDDRGVAVAALPAGRVLVGDSNAAGGGNGFVLLQLLPDGEYDPGFGGGDGIVETPIPGEGYEPGDGSGRIRDLAVLADGRIVAAGYGDDYTGSPPDYVSKLAVVKYLPGGELDPSFGSGGVFSRRFEREGTAFAVEVDSKGRLLLAGDYTMPTGSEMSAALIGRLDANGVPDSSFGSAGFVLRTDTAPFGEHAEHAAVDPLGRLLTLGSAYGGNNTSWASLSRYQGDPAPLPAATVVNKAPQALIAKVPRRVRVGKPKGFRGTASDPDGNGVREVQIALVRKVALRKAGKRKAARRSGGVRCFALRNAHPSFKRAKRSGSRCAQRWLTVNGTAHWSFKFKGKLPPGRYVVFARAIDGAGLAETAFSRKLGNRYGFRVLPPRKPKPRR